MVTSRISRVVLVIHFPMWWALSHAGSYAGVSQPESRVINFGPARGSRFDNDYHPPHQFLKGRVGEFRWMIWNHLAAFCRSYGCKWMSPHCTAGIRKLQSELCWSKMLQFFYLLSKIIQTMTIWMLNKIFSFFLIQEQGARLTYFTKSINDIEVNDISFSECS